MWLVYGTIVERRADSLILLLTLLLGNSLVMSVNVETINLLVFA